MAAGLRAGLILIIIIGVLAATAGARDVTAEVQSIDTLWSGAPAPAGISVANLTDCPWSLCGNYGPYVEPRMYAAWFNGSAYVEVPTSAVGTGDQLAVEVWVQPRKQPGANNIRDIVSSACYGGGLWGIHTAADYNSTFALAYNVGWITGSSTLWVPGVRVRPNDVHHQVVLVLDRAAGRAVVYVDGKPRASAAFPVGAKPATSGFRVGRDCAVSGFAGYVRHVRVYNRALSDSEVWQNYLSPDRPVTAGLAVWLASLDGSDFSGTTWRDRAGGSQGGTAVNVNYTTHGLFPPFTLEALVYTLPSPAWFEVDVGKEDLYTHTSSYVLAVFPCSVYVTVYEGYNAEGAWGVNLVYARCGWVHLVVAARPDGHDIRANGQSLLSTRDAATFTYTQPRLQWYAKRYACPGTHPPAGAAWVRVFSGVPASDGELAELSRGRAPPGLRLLYAANLTASPPQLYAFAGSWDTSRMRMAALARVSGAYADAAALGGPLASVGVYLGSRYSFGVSGRWTQSDDWRGWIGVFSAAGLWLNVTQAGGHGVAAPGVRAGGHAGAYALVYDGSRAQLYANGSLAAARDAQLPVNQFPLGVSLFTPFNSGLRVLLRYAWASPGVWLSTWESYVCGLCLCSFTDGAVPYPTERSYFIDFRWSPPLSFWGFLPPLPAVLREGAPPNAQLEPAVLTGAVATSRGVWGPFGEVCLGRLPDGTTVAFGVRHAWLSPQSSCSVPLPSVPPAGSLSVVPFNATGPLPSFDRPPAQHPLLVNSVPGLRGCSLNASDWAAPLWPVRAPNSTLVSPGWACAPTDAGLPGSLHASITLRTWLLLADALRPLRANTSSLLLELPGGRAAALAARPVTGMSAVHPSGWARHAWTDGTRVYASAEYAPTPPSAPQNATAVSGIVGVPLWATASQWWADGQQYRVRAMGTVSAPAVYLLPWLGDPPAAVLNVQGSVPQGGASIDIEVPGNGTKVWSLPSVTSPGSYMVHVPLALHYTVVAYSGGCAVERQVLFISPEVPATFLLAVASVAPALPVVAQRPFVPVPPVAPQPVQLGSIHRAVVLAGAFAAAYYATRSLGPALILGGALTAALGIAYADPSLIAIGAAALAFGVWQKWRSEEA